MAETPGQRLLDDLRREVVSALNDAVASVVDQVTGLAVDPAFAGPPYAGQVLAPMSPDHPALAVLAALSTDDGGNHVGLHGWRTAAADDAELGVALVVRLAAGPMVVLAVVPSQGPQLTLLASGLTGTQQDVTLAEGLSLRITGTTPSDIDVVISADQPPNPRQLVQGSSVEVELVRERGEPFGVTGGPSVDIGTLSLGGRVFADDAGNFARAGHLTVKGGEVVVAPDFLSGLLPKNLRFPLDADFLVKQLGGLVLGGSPALSVRIPGPDGRWLDAGITVPTDGSVPKLSFTTRLDATLPGAPVSIGVDGIGFELPFALELGVPPLPDPSEWLPADLTGAGVALDLPAIEGSGFLTKVGEDLAGGLTVNIPPMSASAFGVLSSTGEGAPSFLVIMGATFPPPGVQLSFGFAISGLGGVVGVNRRIDREALGRAVSDGTAAALLFPTDPESSGPAAVSALPAIFPPARGSVVAGPMFQISWGGRLVSLSVAVLLESARQVRITILGKLVLALPDPAAPLVLLQATFAGTIEPDVPSVQFSASLVGSHIVGCPITGDLFLLTRGGSDPALIISAGGFHPAFPVPRGVPALKRMSMDLCPVPWMSMRCENYFALTSNTVQLGARLELAAEVAGCGLRGFLGFDALVQFSPFHFVADVAGGIALRAFGETLMGVHLALHLEGPAPYLARGRGSIDLWLFEVSFDFELGWGEPAPAVSADNAGEALHAALAQKASWRSRGSAPPGLVLAEAAQESLSGGTVVDPYGAVTVRQDVVPLGLELQRFRGVPCPPQRWDLVDAKFAENEPAARTHETRDQFAPGLFLADDLDDASLGGPTFLDLRSGLEMLPEPAAGAEQRPADLAWDERLIVREVQPDPFDLNLSSIFASLWNWEVLLESVQVADPIWWPVREAVVVDAVAPVAEASSWSMAPGDTTAGSAVEMEQSFLAGTPMMVVEAWEL